MSKKPLIVFEGVEGSGKTHHINKVANYLTKKKKKFIKIREPGGRKNSKSIRKHQNYILVISKEMLAFEIQTRWRPPPTRP